jgi:hypothetical protein
LGADRELHPAEIDFARQEWRRACPGVRVIAFRSRERDAGRQLALWDEVEYSLQVLLTNEWDAPAAELIGRYRGRAGIEPLIAERAARLRRALLRVPARLVRHGRRRTLRPAPRSLLEQLE